MYWEFTNISFYLLNMLIEKLENDEINYVIYFEFLWNYAKSNHFDQESF